ncbi:MAG TPA: hypothetical protein PLO56_13330 [Rhodothermales bacterium]|nr:hypothetical protein [Rhodothermales bacterium]
MFPKILFFLALSFCFVPVTSAQKVTNGRNVVMAMKAAGKHRKPALTFEQKTIFHRPNGKADTVTWYEAAVPGKLRIDFAPITDGNGVFYFRNKRMMFRNHKLVNTAPDQNILQTLLMDIYQDKPERTLFVLDSLKFNLNVFREDVWNGRKVYVVGATKDDNKAAQFWVDKERKTLVRVIEPKGNLLLDVHVTGYRKMGKVWQEESMLIYLNGKLAQEEYYQNIRAHKTLPASLFDPLKWTIDQPYWL